MLKKVSVFLFFVLFCAIAVTVFTAEAADFGLKQTAALAGYDQSRADVSNTVQTVVSIVLGALALLFFGLTLYGGLVWLTARGKDERVTEAKSTLEAAIVGLIIAAGAYAISTFLFGALQSGQNAGLCVCGDAPSQSCYTMATGQKASDCNAGFCNGNSTYYANTKYKTCTEWEASSQ